jgi:hypothetical protein
VDLSDENFDEDGDDSDDDYARCGDVEPADANKGRNMGYSKWMTNKDRPDPVGCHHNTVYEKEGE